MHNFHWIYDGCDDVISYRARQREFIFVENFLCLFDSTFAKLPNRGPWMVS